MKKLARFISMLVCAFVATHAHAQASVFCPADVAMIVPWDFAIDAPSSTDAARQYAFELRGDSPAILSGDVIVVTDTKAYTVTFDRVQLVRSDDNPKAYISDGAFFQLPVKDAARYAWVDNVTDTAGKRSDCPTFPYEVPKLTAAERANLTPSNPQPVKGVYAFNGLIAKPKMDLPALTCAKPYGDVSPLGDISQTYDFYDPSIVRRPVVEGRVDVDSNGAPVSVEILKSSGAVPFDAYVREWYEAQKYRPALFRCVPVVGSYYFSVQYSQR
jgi:hypothetical protein